MATDTYFCLTVNARYELAVTVNAEQAMDFVERRQRKWNHSSSTDKAKRSSKG